MKMTKCEILDENNKGTGNYIEVPDHLIERAMKGWRFGSGSFKEEEDEKTRIKNM